MHVNVFRDTTVMYDMTWIVDVITKLDRLITVPRALLLPDVIKGGWIAHSIWFNKHMHFSRVFKHMLTVFRHTNVRLYIWGEHIYAVIEHRSVYVRMAAVERFSLV